jgi:hypothetical protein
MVASRHTVNYPGLVSRKGNPMVGAFDEGVAMAKRGRPKKLTGEGSQVRIASDLASKARLIVGDRGVDLADYLSDILRPRIMKDYAAMIRKLEQAEGTEE